MGNKIINILFFVSLLLLPIDGFPLGSQILREFGARPTNFFLLAYAFIFIIKINKPKISLMSASFCALLIVYLAGNLFMVIYDDNGFAHVRNPTTSWCLQLLMLVWMFCSFKIWQSLLNRVAVSKAKLFKKALLFSSLFALACFTIHAIFTYYKFWAVIGFNSFLEIFTGQVSQFRPSGVSTEPSIWGSWVAFVWPLLLLGDKKYSVASKIIGFLLILAAFVSGARTFLVIFSIQLVVLIFYFLLLRVITKKILVIILFILSVCLMYIMSGGYQRVISIANVNENLSSLARIGSSITAFNIIKDNPVLGIGIGQFTNAYGSYAPPFTLFSEEVVSWVEGTSNSRASTFNLFLRVYVELGILFFILSIYIIAKPYFESVRLAYRKMPEQRNYSICYLIAFIGGTTFWFSQDQYGYQVGILSYALLDTYNRLFKLGIEVDLS